MTLWRTTISGGSTKDDHTVGEHCHTGLVWVAPAARPVWRFSPRLRTTIRNSIWPLVLSFWVLWAAPPAFSESVVLLDADGQFDFAQRYFDRGEYFRAIGEYERFVHFFPEDPRIPLAVYQIAMSYFRGRKYPEAIGAFEHVAKNFSGNVLATRAFFMACEALVRMGELQEAERRLRQLAGSSPDPKVGDTAWYQTGWLHMETGRWEKAREAFERMGSHARSVYRIEPLLEELHQASRLGVKDPTVAGILAVLPGAGHLYTGRYRDALIAFILNGGLMWAAYESFDNDQEALGGVITLFGFGFYVGNIYSAVSSAHKHNRNQQDVFRRRLQEAYRIELSAVCNRHAPEVMLSLRISF